MTLIADVYARYVNRGGPDPAHWPHPGIKIDSDWRSDIRPRELWLEQELGAVGDRWTVVYQVDHTWFYFQRPEDATMFALRWAS